MSLHAAHVFGSASIVAEGGVEASFALHKFKIRFKLLAYRRWNQNDLLERLGVAVGGQQRVNQAFPGVDAVRVQPQNLLVKIVGLRRIVARQIDTRQLQLERHAGLASGRDLQLGRAFQKALGDFKLVGPLINSTEHGQKGGIGERRFVGGRRHLLDIGDGLIVLAHLVMRANHALPGGQVARIVVEYLRIKLSGLVEALGLHQDSSVLQLGIRFEMGPVVGKRQRQGEGQHPLRIRVAILGMIDGRQRAQVLRVPGQRNLDRSRDAGGEVERPLVPVVARIGQKQTAPGFD